MLASRISRAHRAYPSVPGTSVLPLPALSRRSFHKSTTMATSGKPEWLCIVPDYPGKLEARMKVRAKHYDNLVEKPFLKFGVAQLEEQPGPDGVLKINGSAVTIEADTREECIELLKQDIYHSSGVWNVDGATITPLLYESEDSNCLYEMKPFRAVVFMYAFGLSGFLLIRMICTETPDMSLAT